MEAERTMASPEVQRDDWQDAGTNLGNSVLDLSDGFNVEGERKREISKYSIKLIILFSYENNEGGKIAFSYIMVSKFQHCRHLVWVILRGGLSYALQKVQQHPWPQFTRCQQQLLILTMSPNIPRCPQEIQSSLVENHWIRYIKSCFLCDNITNVGLYL